MKTIASFTVDHIHLQKGLYVSRQDQVGEETLTTFDLRMKLPNQEILENGSVHTLEHLIATYLRNDAQWGSKIIYFGPMGCLTGMYLIVQGNYASGEILPLVKSAFQFAYDFEGAIPGVSLVECGTASLHSLSGAKLEAKRYLEVLEKAGQDQLNYPA